MFLVGDLHRNFDILKEKITGYAISGNFIQVGDFGLGFDCLQNDIEMLEELNNFFIEHEIKFYVIRGNHDNPEFWKNKEYIPEFSNIKLIDDYTVLNLEGKSICFIGGGISVDRINRTEGFNYWANENVIYDAEKLKNIKDIDILVTHVPSKYHKPDFGYYFEYDVTDEELQKKLDDENAAMFSIYDSIKQSSPNLSHWIYGHFHRSFKKADENVFIKCVEINEIFMPDFERDIMTVK